MSFPRPKPGRCRRRRSRRRVARTLGGEDDGPHTPEGRGAPRSDVARGRITLAELYIVHRSTRLAVGRPRRAQEPSARGSSASGSADAARRRATECRAQASPRMDCRCRSGDHRCGGRCSRMRPTLGGADARAARRRARARPPALPAQRRRGRGEGRSSDDVDLLRVASRFCAALWSPRSSELRGGQIVPHRRQVDRARVARARRALALAVHDSRAARRRARLRPGRRRRRLALPSSGRPSLGPRSTIPTS